MVVMGVSIILLYMMCSVLQSSCRSHAYGLLFSQGYVNLQEWDIDVAKENVPNAATDKYADFLLATASGNIEGVKAPGKLATPFEKTKLAAYTLGAMTPCMRLYAFLGEEVQALLDPSEGPHPYQKWISNYSSEAFQVCFTTEKPCTLFICSQI